MDPHSRSPPAKSTSSERAALDPALDHILSLEQSLALSRFLTLLDAKPIEGSTDRYRIPTGTYHNCLLKLYEEDRELWAEITYKLRHEIILDRELVIMRTSIFHEALTNYVYNLIFAKIHVLKATSSEPIKGYLECIIGHRTAHIELANGTYRSPDDQFKIVGQIWPGVVIETSYSQSLSELTKKAISYLTSSMGHIQMVIGLDATYIASPANLTLHIWNAIAATTPASISREKTLEQEICNETSVSQGSFVIPLKAFGPPGDLASQHPNADLDVEIVIQFDELAACFQKAKRDHDTVRVAIDWTGAGSA